MSNYSKLKVAIVCDWLTGIGGAERVVFELHNMYPEAPIYTSQYDPSKIDWFKAADVRTTWLQKLPSSLKKFLPILRAWTFSHLDLSNYDLVISATGAEAKAVKIGPQTTHVCYCFAPTHYYWSRYDDYLAQPGFPTGFNWAARVGLKLFVGPLRRWDKHAAQKPTYLLAISTHIQKEIKKYYGRTSSVVYPPVDVQRFKPTSQDRHGFVAIGRQTAYKRFDLAVAACTELNLPLTVIGDGPQHHALLKIAGPTIKFDTKANDTDVARYLESAEAFIFPGLDDFGIVAVEAMAAGTPVIAYQAGGALDYVVADRTGLFFSEPTVASLIKTLQQFEAKKFEAKIIASHAAEFSTAAFVDNLREALKNFNLTI